MTDQRIRCSAFDGAAWVCRDQGLPSATAVDLISDKANRWNAEGEPTLYLSGDPALALLESARHPDDLKERSRLFEVPVAIPRVADLREPAVRDALALSDDLHWVLRRERTRQVASFFRRSGMCDALIVPSAGGLDQEDRFNLVVFADDAGRISELFGDPRPVGSLQFSVTDVGAA
jgi:RES domain-containing protein